MQSRIHSWPRLISSFEDVPLHFRSYGDSIFFKPGTFPYTIYVPSYSWDERETNEMLLCISGTDLFIFEQTKSNTQVIRYPMGEIILLSRGAMLLYSWIKIVGSADGEIKTTIVEFNTVTQKLFENLLAMIRLKYNGYDNSTDMDTLSDFSDLSKLDSLSAVDYKFMNYAIKSILPKERIHNFLFQPALSTKYFRYFNKVLSKAHLHILTSTELIAIKEDYPDIRRFKTKKYLVVWNYIPLSRVHNIGIEDYQADKSILLKIELNTEIYLSSIFDISNARSLSELINSLHNP